MSDTTSAHAKRGGSHYLFLLTILIGSFLLFLVQPMIARMALPHRRRRAPFDAPGLDEELLDQILLQAEILDLKANPDKPATGSGGF